jgi:hypothetical protein
MRHLIAKPPQQSESGFKPDDRVFVHNPISGFHHFNGVVLHRSKRSGRYLVALDQWDAWSPIGDAAADRLPLPENPSAVWFSEYELRHEVKS